MNGATLQSVQQEKGVPQAAKAFAAESPTSGLAQLTIRRRAPGPQDVQIDICTAAYVIRICTRCATSGRKRCRQLIRAFRVTRLSAGSFKTGNAVTKLKAG